MEDFVLLKKDIEKGNKNDRYSSVLSNIFWNNVGNNEVLIMTFVDFLCLIAYIFLSCKSGDFGIFYSSNKNN